MSLPNQKSERAAPKNYLEILIIRVAGQWFGVRNDQPLRLLNFQARQLNKPAEPALAGLSGLLGELGISCLPVFDLAHLLELPDSPAASQAGQLVQLNLNGQALGFAIEQAQEFQRAPMSELRQLPPMLKQLRARPAIWAVWQRSAEELIPLLDFNFVLDKTARQAFHLEQV
jgi:chemotaxis signal transduction protein